MQHYLIQRHYIGDANTLEEFKGGVDGLLTAAQLVKEMQLPVRLGLKLAVARDKLRSTVEGQETLAAAIEQRRRLDDADLLIQEDPYDLGSGTSFRQIFCNPIFLSSKTDAGAILNLDMDQFPINTPEALQAAVDLADKTVKDGALFGIGSRSLPPRLGVNDHPSDLRAIDELVHSLCVGPKLVATNPPMGVSPAYARFGESTSGFAVLNTTIPEYGLLMNHAVTASRHANLSGFAADYFMTFAASMRGSITTGYVVTRPNRFYGQPTVEQELASVEKTIFSQTIELAETCVTPLLARIITKKNEFTNALSEFYSLKDVVYILDLKKRAIFE